MTARSSLRSRGRRGSRWWIVESVPFSTTSHVYRVVPREGCLEEVGEGRRGEKGREETLIVKKFSDRFDVFLGPRIIPSVVVVDRASRLIVYTLGIGRNRGVDRNFSKFENGERSGRYSICVCFPTLPSNIKPTILHIHPSIRYHLPFSLLNSKNPSFSFHPNPPNLFNLPVAATNSSNPPLSQSSFLGLSEGCSRRTERDCRVGQERIE